MSVKANPTLVGLFMLAGAALGVAGLVLFSSGRFFTETLDCIVYFASSLNGLNEGAPVKLRGVTIGAVKKVMINFNQATNDYAMPVIVQIREDLLRERIADPFKLMNVRDLRAAVDRGLRASLAAESLVTGVLYVDLDTHHDAGPPVFHQVVKVYPEIPTRPTQIQQLFRNLSQVDIKKLEERVNSLIATIDAKAQGFKAEEISTNLITLVASLNQVVRLQELTNSIAAFGLTMERYRSLADRIESRVAPVADGVTNSLAEVDRTLAQLRGSVDDLRNLIGPDAALRNELTLALSQIATAAQSLAELTDFLRRYPNALISGRAIPDKKP